MEQGDLYGDGPWADEIPWDDDDRLEQGVILRTYGEPAIKVAGLNWVPSSLEEARAMMACDQRYCRGATWFWAGPDCWAQVLKLAVDFGYQVGSGVNLKDDSAAYLASLAPEGYMIGDLPASDDDPLELPPESDGDFGCIPLTEGMNG